MNHFIWLTRLHEDGKDALPVLEEWVEKKAKSYWEKCPLSSELGPKAFDLYRRFGAFPIGDTCTPGGGPWPWWYHVDKETEGRWNEDPEGRWSFVLKPPPENPVLKLAEVAGDPATKVTSAFPPTRSGEVTVSLIESIACNIHRVFIVNLMNREELVQGVPSNFEVEVPAGVAYGMPLYKQPAFRKENLRRATKGIEFPDYEGLRLPGAEGFIDKEVVILHQVLLVEREYIDLIVSSIEKIKENVGEVKF